MRYRPDILCFKYCILLLWFVFAAISCQHSGQPCDVPHVYIQVDENIPVTNKIAGTMQVTCGQQNENYTIRIERRGGYSISFHKHSYEIDLDKDKSLAGLPADDDWILNANYIDKTFLRHVISYEIFRDMHPDNLAPLCRFIELSVNGDFKGLYVLMQKLDRSSLSVDRSDSSAFIFKEPHVFRPDYENVTPQKKDNFHQQTFPKIAQVDQSRYLDQIRRLLLSKDTTSFQSQLCQMFDLDNLLDWHLLLMLTHNGDGILKNFYLYKQDNQSPIRISPWDYDHSFGRDGDNEKNMLERPLRLERSILFQRLLQEDWYLRNLKERWLKHNRNDILSEEALHNRILDHVSLIKPITERNFELWPVSGEHYYDDNTFDEEIDLMLQFITLNHQRMAAYFESMN